MDNLEYALNMDEMAELVKKLNYYRDMYYNHNKSEISDHDYDCMFDRLNELEALTGFVMTNSPTSTVGYEVKSTLNKVKHNHPMLSLDKTKSVDEVLKFFEGKEVDIMAKMDGLTCSLHYNKGKLISAETRGDGMTGEDVTHNAKVIPSIPKTINTYSEVVIDGEVIVTRDDFDKINASIKEEDRYCHPRNYASGSVRQLDSRITEQRNLTFVAWKVIEGCNEKSFFQRWKFLCDNGFIAVPFINLGKLTKDMTETAIKYIKEDCEKKSYPIDGCVFAFDDTRIGEARGKTSHHFKDQLAFKFYDDSHETKLTSIDWTMGKTGVLTPTAVFKPVVIDGTTITRASLHNISIIKKLGLSNNCTISVFKANQVIPQIDSCEQDGDSEIIVPHICPVCGARTEIKKDNDSEVLVCLNKDCAGKKLAKFVNYVSRKCANIIGLSEATLELLISRGYIHKFSDLYHLDKYADEIKGIEGFGKQSVNKLLESINASRCIKFDNYVNAIGIEGIGSSNAKIIAKHFNNDCDKFYDALNSNFDFSTLEGFGNTMNEAIYEWYKTDELSDGLREELKFTSSSTNTDSTLSGLKFCITGTFSKSRDDIKAELESKGATFVSSVSKNLDVLFAGENAGSKLNKASALGIKIADEAELNKMLGDSTIEKPISNTEDSSPVQTSLWD